MRYLKADQKQQRQIADEDGTCLPRVITDDGSWIYDCVPQTKQQFSQWKSPNSLTATSRAYSSFSLMHLQIGRSSGNGEYTPKVNTLRILVTAMPKVGF
jgi:hypothetical protein